MRFRTKQMNLDEALKFNDKENKKITVEIQSQMYWMKTVPFKSCFSTVLLLKKEYYGFKKNVRIFDRPKKRKKCLATQLFFVRARRTLGGS